MVDWQEERGWIGSQGHRLRCALTLPLLPRHPAVLLLPGLGAGSRLRPLSQAAPGDGVARLLRSWSAAGFATLRVDPCGVGESGGPGYGSAPLGCDLDAHEAALSWLRARPSVDPEGVFVLGHSLGGVLAPFLAGAASARGVIVYGTTSRRWSQCLADTARRQLALAGVDAGDAEREAALAARLYQRLLRDRWSPARVRAEEPELAASIAGRDVAGDRLHGRSLAYLRELDGLDPEAGWRRAGPPVLALHGEHDWVVADDDHERIAAWARDAGRRATARTLPGLDHELARHASRAASHLARGRGAADEAAAEVTIDWMARELSLGSSFTRARGGGDNRGSPEASS